MAATIDICNRALSLIGEDVIASLDEASEPARKCKLWWDPSRQAVLRAAFWGSARKAAVLNLLDVTPAGWSYAYLYPGDCLHARFIGGSQLPPFTVSTLETTGGLNKVILTNATSPTLHYTFDNTDPTTWDIGLEQAVTHALAGNIAYALTGKRALKLDQFQLANQLIEIARGQAMNELLRDFSQEPGRVRAMNSWDDLDWTSPFIAPDGPLLI